MSITLNLVTRSTLAAVLLSYSLTACSDSTKQREAESYILPENYVGAF